MNGRNGRTIVGQLVLARLLVAGEKGATTTELKKALEPLLGHRWSGAALADQLAWALDDLDKAGLAGRARKGKTERGTLTPEGRRHALEFLGLDQLPPKATWDQLKKTALAARALGLPTPSDKAARLFGGDPGFKAALLKAQFGLPLGDFPTFDQAIDALAWTLLGFEPGPKFTLKAVKGALLGREVEGRRQVDPKADFKKEAARLLARKVGARQSGKDELRLAALRRWIDRASEPEPEPTPAPAPAPPAPLELDAFARRVVEAARSSPSGRFGDNKVFVIHVWRALHADPAFAAMGLDGFKRRLAEANNARRLDLSRADMVEAMDRDDVRLSEVAYLGATFHFVRI
jgi:hypothetical protein